MSKSILIIDDDSRNIFALSAVLKAKNFTCVSASGMKDAFSILTNNCSVGIILIDMMMPEMDGYEALPALKSHKQYKHIPLIAVTAQAMAGDKEKCLAAGADDYMAKPVDIDLLIDLVNKHIK